jgi:hypothetical protein
MLDARIKALTTARDALAGKMIAMLENAAFDNQPIDPAAAAALIKQLTTCSAWGPDGTSLIGSFCAGTAVLRPLPAA